MSFEAADFNKLMDEIKDTNIGQKLMQHVQECEKCKEQAVQLNIQAMKHIQELESLT